MEIFTHINELGRTGWSQLRTLVLACPRVVLWSPSASYLNSFRARDPLLPEPAELLEYVRRGNVQVMARKWWLLNRERRRKRASEWSHARWTEGFDDQLLRMWEEDQANGRDTTGRVLLVGEEEGLTWAQEQIRTRKVDPKEIVRRAFTRRELHAYFFRAKRRKTNRDRAIELLRNARNHGLALRDSGANRNLGSPRDRALLEVFTEAAKTGHKAAPTKATGNTESLMTSIAEVLESLRRAGKPPRTAQEARRRVHLLLDDVQELERFRRWVNSGDEFAATSGDLGLTFEELKSRLLTTLGRTPEASLLKKMHLHSPVEFASFGAELSLLALHRLADGHQSFLLQLAIFILAHLSDDVLESRGFKKANYAEDRWPFYVGWGRGDVRRTWIKQLQRDLAD